MMNTKHDNDVTDSTSAVYTKIGTKFLFSIPQDATYLEN